MKDQRTTNRDTVIDFLANTMRDMARKQDSMIEDVATIKTQILAFPPYMVECSTEREEIKDRIGKYDLAKARRAGQVSILVAFTSGSGACLGFIASEWAKIKGWL